MKQVTKQNAETIYYEAYRAAIDATQEYLNKYGEGMMNCGFAWVTINPATGPMVKFLKDNHIGGRAYPKGYSVWNPSQNYTQDMSAKEMGAYAFAKVLREYGVNATVGTRLD